jgi:hypothetical protein
MPSTDSSRRNPEGGDSGDNRSDQHSGKKSPPLREITSSVGDIPKTGVQAFFDKQQGKAAKMGGIFGFSDRPPSPLSQQDTRLYSGEQLDRLANWLDKPQARNFEEIQEKAIVAASKRIELEQAHRRKEISQDTLNDKMTLLAKDAKYLDYYDRGAELALKNEEIIMHPSQDFLKVCQGYIKECQEYITAKKSWDAKNLIDLTNHPNRLDFPIDDKTIKVVTEWVYRSEKRNRRAAGLASAAYEWVRQFVPIVEDWPEGSASDNPLHPSYNFLSTAYVKVADATREAWGDTQKLLRQTSPEPWGSSQLLMNQG